MGFLGLLRIYSFAAISTALIWLVVGWKLGLTALFFTVVLTMLEITFSADNAVVNSKVLVTLSRMWQNLFMTIGIFIAVFVVRFALPIVLVMLSASLGFSEVLNLALHHPAEYQHHLHTAEPIISAFGGTFLLMIALSYFIDYEKKTHWLGFLERHLGELGRFDNVTTFITLALSIILYFTVEPTYQGVVLVAAISAMVLHIGLGLVNAAMSGHGKAALKPKIGLAAFVGFLYLQVLDASFSLDGVIGAFAITSDVIIIMAGLGAGAVWVRAMTIHMVRAKTLKKYIFLEHGAHWAIGFLGAIMLLRLYSVELPEWVVGSLGICFIALSVWWSRRQARKIPDSAPL